MTPDLKQTARAPRSSDGSGSRDRFPPHDSQAERATIGCALQDAALASELRLEWFYDLRYRQMAEILMGMAAARQPIDTATAYQAMTAAGVKEAIELISECDSACLSPANFPYWRDVLTDKLTLRRIIQTAQRAVGDAYDTSQDSTRKPLECLDDYERAALSIRRELAGAGSGDVDNRETMLELVKDYEDAANEKRPLGLATGFYELDKLIGGLKPQQLFILAARPAVGKTSLALSVIEHLALDGGLAVGFFSLEMSGKELLHRIACSRARVDGLRMNDGSASEQEIQKMALAAGKIVKAPLHICDAGGLTIAQLTVRARRMVQQHGIKILFVDYLGLLRSGEKGRSRYEETTLVSNALKALAKELNLPIVALAQLNRDTEREIRVPRLSDLRDSGAIEQDADIVALLHRDEDQTGETQTVSVILAKQRSGRTGKVDLTFHRAFTRFENKSIID